MRLDSIFDRELVEQTEGEIVVLENKSDQNPLLTDNYHGTLRLTKEEFTIIQTENCQKTKHNIRPLAELVLSNCKRFTISPTNCIVSVDIPSRHILEYQPRG